MDMDTNDKTSPILPEIDIYLHLNVLIYLMDKNELEKVCMVYGPTWSLDGDFVVKLTMVYYYPSGAPFG